MEHARESSDLEMPPHQADGSFRNGQVELTEMKGSPRDWSTESVIDEHPERPSNEKLLSTAFVSFMLFTLCQAVAAVIAGSEAMMGDSAAMFVDALTYLFNLVAERKKNDFDDNWQGTMERDPERARRIRQRAKRKMILTMELIPPLISVSTLITVTAFVLREAIRVLKLDVHRDVSLQGDPNLSLMLAFSTANLGLDAVNVFCFAKAKHLMGFETLEGHPGSPTTLGEKYEAIDATDLEMPIHEKISSELLKSHGRQLHTNSNYEESDQDDKVIIGDDDDDWCSPDPPGLTGDEVQQSSFEHFDSSDSSDEDEKSVANLNMCSAYTHVFADTLRSIAVIVASVTAELVDGVTPEEADATAAVVVSALILLSLLPLFRGLMHTFSGLRAIRAEESSEKMFLERTNTKTSQVGSALGYK